MSSEEKSSEERLINVKWQGSMLSNITSVITRLTVFFCVTTLIQLCFLNWKMHQSPSIQLLSKPSLKHEVILETYVIEQRYHHTNIALMSHIWTRYLGFFTGMILALIGAMFILGKLEDKDSSLEGKFATVQYKLQSASPGIILTVLGVILISITIVNPSEIRIIDRPLYIPSIDQLESQNNSKDNIQKPPLNIPFNDK